MRLRLFLIRIAVRIFVVPLHSGVDNFFQIGELRFPAQFGEGLCGVGCQDRSVAGPAVYFCDLEVFARDLFNCFDHLSDGVAFAVAQVVYQFAALV